MRRTRSLDTVTDEAKLARDYGLRRRWSVDGPYVVEDLEPEIPADEIEGDDAAECEGNLDMTDFEWFRRWHTRKASAGIDSGVDVGSVDEGPSVALKRDSEPLAE